MSEFGQRYATKSVTIASGQTTSSAFDKEEFDRVAFSFPTMTGTTIDFAGCDTFDGTYLTITGAQISSPSGATIPLTDDADLKGIAPFRYIKLISGSAEASGRTITVYLARE